MNIDVEYAIKKDVRNNPVVRGVDVQQRRELVRSLLVGAAVVSMLLFSAWQHYQLIDHSYKVQGLLTERASEERLNRRLRLEVESLRAPDLVEKRAMRELGMVYPAPEQTLVIERVSSSTAPRAIVASAR
ncbi:MAG TPA: cell division protein FtsL [Vicinamibacterales bacterium]|nr:cell division protein FtsL [Vicinamibacterales bacterium]